jgi:hypothetical protein
VSALRQLPLQHQLQLSVSASASAFSFQPSASASALRQLPLQFQRSAFSFGFNFSERLGEDLKILTSFVKIRYFCYNLRLRMQSNRVSTNAFVKKDSFYYDARYDCRVQSLRRPDAAEKGDNVALIAVHGVIEGSSAFTASERVTLIQ